jgi:endonuclease/exonuclease/phosphatase family metal-dependent hydrolase
MAFFYDFEQWVRDHPPTHGDRRALDIARVATNLMDLRASLDDSEDDNYVPPKTTYERLLVATWNIQHFGSSRRYEESLFYIAEILSRFDLIAIQEVKQSLEDLEAVRGLLGHWWRYLVTDVTAGNEGNEERLAFLFDTRKVRFGGMAGEMVLPAVENDDGDDIPSRQLARTPIVAGFQSGWFDFLVSAVHLYWGDVDADHPTRVEEMRQFAGNLAARVDENGAWSRNLLILGDFNMFNPDGEAAQALKTAGFEIPHGREDLRATNVGRDARFYDQVAYIFADHPEVKPERIGVVDPFDVIYSDAKFPDYEDEIRKADGTPPSNKFSYYKNHWRRREMSDHLLLWAELPIEFAARYLEAKAEV